MAEDRGDSNSDKQKSARVVAPEPFQKALAFCIATTVLVFLNLLYQLFAQDAQTVIREIIGSNHSMSSSVQSSQNLKLNSLIVVRILIFSSQIPCVHNIMS
jgi:hypothetical protein